MSTVNVDDFVKKAQSTFVEWATRFAMLKIIEAAPFLGWALINLFTAAAVKWLLTTIARDGEFVAFIVNTNIRTTDQARDYEAAVAVKNNLPEGATDDEIKRAEQAELDAFDSLVRLNT